MERIIDGERLNVPEHVAIVLDGNGRWAKKRHLPRNFGHKEGAKAVEDILEVAWNMGIKYLTVYAFSTENWKRPQAEVDALMMLLRNYLKDCLERIRKNNMRIRVIGDKTGLQKDIRDTIEDVERKSADNTGLQFTLALNYGSRDEIVRAMKKMCAAPDFDPEKITEENFSSYLDTAGIPDPDLVIRTSGEQRISNFLLWQMAYAEFYFPEVLWPDFDRAALLDAVRAYSQRDRRFGGIKA